MTSGTRHALFPVAVVLLMSAVAANAKSVTVQTALGPVQGSTTDLGIVFRGVPYAEPPVDALRWKAPVAVKAWGPDPIVATSDKPGCWQHCDLPPHTCPPVMSEDCLYMNIFTPLNATASSKLPVMLFIHGGNFKQGYAGGGLYDGQFMAHNENVIMVVIQYRLGSIGFLHSDGEILGNFGLQDQRLSFAWVRNYIAAFGGDPESLTVFGQSAGAMSVAAHMSSPLSKGAFDRAIMESEPFGLPFRTPSAWKDFASAFAKDLGCPETGYDECIRGKTAQELLASQVKVEKDLLADLTSSLLSAFLPWTPTAGTPELPMQPLDTFTSGAAHVLPYTIGTVATEGESFVFSAFGKPVSTLELDVLLTALFGLGNLLPIREQYPLPAGSKDSRGPMVQIATDALFDCPTRNVTLTGSVQRGHNPYRYHYDHQMADARNIWGPNYTECAGKVEGSDQPAVCHAAELVPVFGVQNSSVGIIFTKDEVLLSETLQGFWSNFARSGNPNSPKLVPSVSWPALTEDEHEMLFMTPANQLQTAPARDKCQLWNRIGYHYAVPK